MATKHEMPTTTSTTFTIPIGTGWSRWLGLACLPKFREEGAVFEMNFVNIIIVEHFYIHTHIFMGRAGNATIIIAVQH